MSKMVVKQQVTFTNQSVKGNGIVNLSFNSSYPNLVKTIQVMQFLNNDVKIFAKLDGKVLRLGIFRVKSLNVDGDGESKLHFTSSSDYVEMEGLKKLSVDSRDKEFYIKIVADVETEEEKKKGVDYGE